MYAQQIKFKYFGQQHSRITVELQITVDKEMHFLVFFSLIVSQNFSYDGYFFWASCI